MAVILPVSGSRLRVPTRGVISALAQDLEVIQMSEAVNFAYTAPLEVCRGRPERFYSFETWQARDVSKAWFLRIAGGCGLVKVFARVVLFLLRGDTKMPPPAFGWPVLMDWDGWVDMLRYLTGIEFHPFFFLLSSLRFSSCILFLYLGLLFLCTHQYPCRLFCCWFGSMSLFLLTVDVGDTLADGFMASSHMPKFQPQTTIRW